MRFLSRRPAAPLVDIHDYDDVNYTVVVHVPLEAAQPSSDTIRDAICEKLGLPAERVTASAYLPYMGG